MKIFLIFLFLVACAEQSKSTKSVISRKVVYDYAYHALQKRELKSAAKYLTLLANPQNETEIFLFAQFHLMACNAKKTLSLIQQVENQQEKKLFLGTIAALASIERNDNTLDQKKKTVTEQLVMNIDSSEVWSDEWDDIDLPKHCEKLSLARQDQQKYLLNYSTETLMQLPEDIYARDLNLLALGLDIGYPFEHLSNFLEIYKAQKDHPYYAMLEKQVNQPTDLDNFKEDKKLRKKNEIVLTDLNLNKEVIVPKKIDIPFLLPRI